MRDRFKPKGVCKDCAFWRFDLWTTVSGQKWSECREGPPTAAAGFDTAPQHGDTFGAWLKTPENGFCGRFQKRDEE